MLFFKYPGFDKWGVHINVEKLKRNVAKGEINSELLWWKKALNSKGGLESP